MQALFVTALAGALTFGAGFLALRREEYRGPIFAVGAGVLIATALLTLIPESLELLSPQTHEGYESALMVCALGFLSFYLLEGLTHHDEGGASDVVHHGHRHQTGIWGAAGIAVHGFFDGFAIAEAFASAGDLGWAVGAGIAVHKLADGVSVTGVMQGTRHGRRETISMLLIASLAPFLGVFVQPFFALPTEMFAWLLSWFAGVFLYLGATSLLPAAHEVSGTRTAPFYAIGGALLVLFAITVGGH